MSELESEIDRLDALVNEKDAEIAALTESERVLAELVMELRDENERIRAGEPSTTLRNFRDMDARIEFLEKAFEELQADDERNYQSTRNWDYLDAHLPTYAAYLRELDSRPPSGGVQSGVQEGDEDEGSA